VLKIKKELEELNTPRGSTASAEFRRLQLNVVKLEVFERGRFPNMFYSVVLPLGFRGWGADCG